MGIGMESKGQVIFTDLPLLAAKRGITLIECRLDGGLWRIGLYGNARSYSYEGEYADIVNKAYSWVMGLKEE